MELLGVGLPELAFIVLIALILLGPKDMVAAGRAFGRALRKFLTSPAWQAMRQTGEELQKLPTKLVREAGLEELQAMQNEVQNEIKDVTRQIRPPDLKNAFDEHQIFNSPESTAAPTPNPAPKPVPPLNQPENPSEPPPAPEA